jgi:hypothetical protein
VPCQSNERTRRVISHAIGALLLPWSLAVSQAATAAPAKSSVPSVDQDLLFISFGVLAADSMEGRLAGAPGGARARKYLASMLEQIGVEPLVKGFTMQFSARSRVKEGPTSSPVATQGRPGFMGGVGRQTHTKDSTANFRGIDGANLLAVVRGTEHPQRYIVVSAHYDHLGPGFNGADDNASGTAAILAISEWAHAHPPQNSIIFAFFDAEEEGLLGSRAFFDKLPVPIDSIILDVNLDMVSRNENGELYAAGTFKWHAERPMLDSVAALHLVNLRFGHDSPGVADWSRRSDMAPFDERHIPFVHFGVEEHPDYHRPSDRPEKVQPAFFYHSVLTAAAFIHLADASLDIIAKERHSK